MKGCHCPVVYKSELMSSGHVSHDAEESGPFGFGSVTVFFDFFNLSNSSAASLETAALSEMGGVYLINR